ncbi:gamma-glutamyl-gamma-aminobutyrate hydrolase family protein [Massilia cavernae]|uniref:gamma-glutamyl-gamma-aminobutyrate hydrolase n=1 Tax=Massilia cavernae TaxID=2320864 RepID=A0A418XRZ0_9BURK|nr:gamma-glutamyl-gamma-aminobutyrate hydrolase family protein [Massilia cavernae]RJG15213.1 gamma-glutamyl-gamma-aminobutyrate hydrolase family protein [Massilia cavernae]
MRRPIVIVPACTRELGNHPYHAVQCKYIDAVVQGAGCAPLIMPALGDASDFETALAVADGIMLTGSASNVHSSYYQQDLRDPALPLDPARDATTLPLIRAALKRGVPIFAVCRGFQEMNVALGGSLHQAVQEVEGMMDHRENPADTLDNQYRPKHPVDLVAGGLMQRILDGASEIVVNSLHGQGIDRQGKGIAIEATAHDGLVEAFSVPGVPFALAVQWHPEWHLMQNPDSLRLFRAFGEACRAYQKQRPEPA